MSDHVLGVVGSEREVLLERFANHLLSRRGVARSTADVYTRHVGPFIDSVTGSAGGGLATLDGPVVRAWITERGCDLAPQALKLVATAVRAFLRFAWSAGLTKCDLSPAVGPVIVHRSAGLPKALTQQSVRLLLEAPNRSTAVGERDFAILLLLVRFGLRAGEVASLRLDDIDWASAMFSVTVKGGRLALFPLPRDVGDAVVAYLRVRPPVAHREVFVAARGAHAPMTAGAVTQVVYHSARRAGIGEVRAHRLRHTAARAVLVGGGSFRDVGELLGHATQQMSVTYSSFDVASLAVLARPWPIGAENA